MTTATSHVPADWRGQIVTFDGHDLPLSEEGRQGEPGTWSAVKVANGSDLVAKRTKEHTIHISVDLQGDLFGEPFWNTFGWMVISNKSGEILHAGVVDTLTKAMKAAESAPADR